jgi:drug/metabolite transporter (DMT)-like permease
VDSAQRPALFPEWPALIAIATWGSLPAVSGDALSRIHPGPLLTVALASAAVAFAVVERVRGQKLALVFHPRPRDLLLGLYGLGVYHAILFLAFERAPLIEANLINDLWPLLTVLLAAPIVKEKLTGRALGGAMLGLAGSVVVVLGDASRATPSAASSTGYALALAAALIWSSFTNFIKLWPIRPSAMSTAAALSAAACGVWTWLSGDALPTGTSFWASVYLGALPLGVAIAFWEMGVTRGRVMVVGALSYLTPLLATLCVWFFLGRPLHPSTALGGALILGGAVVGTWRGKPPKAEQA